MSWQVTHRRIQSEAFRLFSDRGFDEVTVDEVARAAGVSHMTFFRHFPTKESVVLDDPFDPMIGAAVADQDAELPPLVRACLGVWVAWTRMNLPDDAWLRERLRLAAAHPGLRARAWENNHRTEQVVTAALERGGTPSLEAKIAAGAVLGALTAALFDWADRDDDESLGSAIRSALEIISAQELAT